MVINNQKAQTERRQFLEQNVTLDCDISLDPEINMDCCEIANGTQEWNGNPCHWFYKCDKNNFHCVLNDVKIMGFCLLIFLIVVLGCAIIVCVFEDLIRRKLNNLRSNLPLIFDRRTEAISMEMKE